MYVIKTIFTSSAFGGQTIGLIILSNGFDRTFGFNGDYLFFFKSQVLRKFSDKIENSLSLLRTNHIPQSSLIKNKKRS